MFSILYLAETHREGTYQTGDVLFTSQTNSVSARFTSDDNVRGKDSGWMSDPSLVLKVHTDVRSTACTEGIY